MNTILQGDCRQVLSTLPAESVQTCVTSPPYFGLRDYGVDGQIGLEQTPDAYVAEMVAVFREVRRVLKGDGTLWLNLGDSYASSGGERTYGSSDEGTGRGPGTRRHDQNAIGLKPKDLIGIPWAVAFALRADGWYLRQDIIWHKPNPMPESVTDRCTKAHEYVFLLSKSARYYYDVDAIREPHTSLDKRAGRNSACLVDRSPNPRKGMRSSDPERFGLTRGKTNESCTHENGRNRRSVWTVATKPYKGAHFATYPPKLIEPCILAGSRPGDTVLDPFNGSGTTGEVATMHGRDYIGVELNPEYVALTHKRLGGVQMEMTGGGK